jgi:hypothetical protein
MFVVHKVDGKTLWKCEPQPRKDNKALFPKWFCTICKRFVLPDGKKHFTVFDD